MRRAKQVYTIHIKVCAWLVRVIESGFSGNPRPVRRGCQPIFPASRQRQLSPKLLETDCHRHVPDNGKERNSSSAGNRDSWTEWLFRSGNRNCFDRDSLTLTSLPPHNDEDSMNAPIQEPVPRPPRWTDVAQIRDLRRAPGSFDAGMVPALDFE